MIRVLKEFDSSQNEIEWPNSEFETQCKTPRSKFSALGRRKVATLVKQTLNIEGALGFSTLTSLVSANDP